MFRSTAKHARAGGANACRELSKLALIVCSTFVTWATLGEASAQELGGGDAGSVDVLLEQRARDTWRVTYSLDVPVDALNFGPPVGDFRATSFALPAELELVALHGEERLRRRDGGALRRAVIDVSLYNAILPKHYVPFNDFSDGSASVFVGYLIPNLTRNDTTSATRARFDFKPRQGESVVHGGARAPRLSNVQADQQSAPFVYLGGIEPVETDALIAVLDPALPDWIGTALSTHLPRIFALYEEKLGRTLQARPSVLVSFHLDPNYSGYSMKGGTRPGQIQIRLVGERFDANDPDLLAAMIKFFAHEGAHLWQEPILTDKEESWIHEGGADALAFATLGALGVWDEERLAEARSRARDDCAAGLRGFSLLGAAERGEFDLYYSCGLVIALATETELRRHDPNASLEEFWRALYETATQKGSRYTLALYVDVMRSLGARESVTEAIEAFVESPQDDPGPALDALLLPTSTR